MKRYQQLKRLKNDIGSATFLDKNEYGNLLNLKTAPILPNQNGVFKYKDILQIDNTEFVAEELKDICKLLNFDFRNDI